jgi:hypothetical protein
MIVALDEAYHIASDLPDSTLQVVEYHETGRPGRPRIEFEPSFLSFALELRGPTDIARVFRCSPRTIRRRALELGLLRAGQEPFRVIESDGTAVRFHNGPQKRTRLSDISDDDLDTVISTILRDFPDFGRRMIDGRLRSQGLLVPRSRIRASFQRVRGRVSSFIRHRIVRREYRVAGVNSLWHHDGQHGEALAKYYDVVLQSILQGLAKYKLYVHGFIDGKTRYVTGLRVHNNNRASTIAVLFHEARSIHGTPRRLRGDHGTENIEVAEWVDVHNGLGSYLWGPYVIIF